MRDLPRLLGTQKAPTSVADHVENELMALVARAEELLKQLDWDQDVLYGENAKLSLQIQHNEAQITRGADLARRLQQVRSVLETGIEERDA